MGLGLPHRLTHSDTHTDAGNDNTRRQNWPGVQKNNYGDVNEEIHR